MTRDTEIEERTTTTRKEMSDRSTEGMKQRIRTMANITYTWNEGEGRRKIRDVTYEGG